MSMITPMRFSPDNDGVTPFHSSAYAHAANGERLGSVSSQSYAERRHLERNRQHVRHYGHSQLGQSVGELRAVSVPPRPEVARVQRLERPAIGTPTPQRYAFHEPPARYNPYQ